MDQREVFDRLNRVFREVFDDETIRVTPKTTADDIDDWDSLEHITLISAVEREFRMKFKMGEISSMKNVGEMARIVTERMKRSEKPPARPGAFLNAPISVFHSAFPPACGLPSHTDWSPTRPGQKWQ